MPEKIEHVILRSLVTDEDFARKVLPYIKEEYFTGLEKPLYGVVYKFFEKYGKLPSKEAISIEIYKDSTLNGEDVDGVLEILAKPLDPQEPEWLLNETESWCRDKAIYNSLAESLDIYSGKDKKRDKGAIPGLVTEALGISFDPRVGHDFLEDADSRYDFYHTKTHKIPFDLELFNTITKGGIEKKTLNLVMAGIGVGKTIFLCHNAAHYLNMGLNVIYITMEMAEEKISQRIDANLMGITIDELMAIPKDVFQRKIEKIKDTTKGKLIVKEYPSGSAHAGHFRHLVHELKLKKGFVPDIVLIDYINICASSRLKKSAGAAETSYFIQSIAEEIRGLATELNVPIWSACQFTRSGYENSDPSLAQVAQSWGLPATADFMIGLVKSDTLEKLNQLMAKQLKNRYGPDSKIERFVVGVDKDRMKFYDVEQKAQSLLSEDGEIDPQKEKLEISKKHGSVAYESGYQVRRFGKKPAKRNFDNIKMGEA